MPLGSAVAKQGRGAGSLLGPVSQWSREASKGRQGGDSGLVKPGAIAVFNLGTSFLTAAQVCCATNV